MRAQLQEIFGYCLVPACNYHSFFFWRGEGGTGKSTVFRVLEMLVGESNVVSVRPENWDQEYHRASLVGKSVYVCPEATGKTFQHMDVIKAIVSGDPISVRQPYKPMFTYRPSGRLILSSNFNAATGDTTGGFGRRFYQMNFDQVIPEAERRYDDYEEKMFGPELAGIFAWAIRGFRRLHERGRFEHTAASREATAELLRHRDSVRSFLRDAAWVRVMDLGDPKAREVWTSYQDLHGHYLDWCEACGVNPYYDDAGAFSREAQRKVPELRERKKRIGMDRVMHFQGVERVAADAAGGGGWVSCRRCVGWMLIFSPSFEAEKLNITPCFPGF